MADVVRRTVFAGISAFLGASAISAHASARASTQGKCAGERFEIYKDKTGGYRWRLHAQNGKNIADHESYSSRSACVAAVRRVAAAAARAEITFADECGRGG